MPSAERRRQEPSRSSRSDLHYQNLCNIFYIYYKPRIQTSAT